MGYSSACPLGSDFRPTLGSTVLLLGLYTAFFGLLGDSRPTLCSGFQPRDSVLISYVCLFKHPATSRGHFLSHSSLYCSLCLTQHSLCSETFGCSLGPSISFFLCRNADFSGQPLCALPSFQGPPRRLILCCGLLQSAFLRERPLPTSSLLGPP